MPPPPFRKSCVRYWAHSSEGTIVRASARTASQQLSGWS